MDFYFKVRAWLLIFGTVGCVLFGLLVLLGGK